MAELNSSAHVSSSDPSSRLALCKRAVASYMRSYSIMIIMALEPMGVKKQVRG